MTCILQTLNSFDRFTYATLIQEPVLKAGWLKPQSAPTMDPPLHYHAYAVVKLFFSPVAGTIHFTVSGINAVAQIIRAIAALALCQFRSACKRFTYSTISFRAMADAIFDTIPFVNLLVLNRRINDFDVDFGKIASRLKVDEIINKSFKTRNCKSDQLRQLQLEEDLNSNQLLCKPDSPTHKISLQEGMSIVIDDVVIASHEKHDDAIITTKILPAFHDYLTEKNAKWLIPLQSICTHVPMEFLLWEFIDPSRYVNWIAGPIHWEIKPFAGSSLPPIMKLTTQKDADGIINSVRVCFERDLIYKKIGNKERAFRIRNCPKIHGRAEFTVELREETPQISLSKFKSTVTRLLSLIDP